jgi:hypothetical protein
MSQQSTSQRAKILAGFATLRQYSPQVWNPGISTGNVADDDERPPLRIRHLSDNVIDPATRISWSRWLKGGAPTVSNSVPRVSGNLRQEGCAGDVAETSIAP